MISENTQPNYKNLADGRSDSNGELEITQWVIWVKDTAILTTIGASIGCFIAPSMWPAWLMMAIFGWGHYGDVVIIKLRHMPNDVIQGPRSGPAGMEG